MNGYKVKCHCSALSIKTIILFIAKADIAKADIAVVDAIFMQKPGGFIIFCQQQVTVVMKVANDG
ncbi:hypothetical protein [Endozoicomonas sp.]|uniref:hypothetical protein n=1 Tax=Endozoicomonas sp. TaxID=1892382 RepID=UPI00383AE17F